MLPEISVLLLFIPYTKSGSGNEKVRIFFLCSYCTYIITVIPSDISLVFYIFLVQQVKKEKDTIMLKTFPSKKYVLHIQRTKSLETIICEKNIFQ
jgi:hypothetical protein